MKMSWGITILIALLTAAAGAAATWYLATLCVEWYRISPREGGSAYFIIAIGFIGLVAGLISGVVIARLVHSGFWIALGYSLAFVVGLCLVAGFFARTNGEVAPTIDGDQLRLDVELKCPRGWQPGNKARSRNASNCWLETVGPRLKRGPSTNGTVEWRGAREEDGQWIVPCSVWLFSSRENRYVRMVLGDKTDVTFYLNLPERPGIKQKQWSAWSNEGFSYEVGKAPVTDYAYRCRNERLSEVVDEGRAAVNAGLAEHDKLAAELPADAPIAQWIALFRDLDGSPAYRRWGGSERRERTVVASRALELAPLLVSHDRTLQSEAVFALGSLFQTPAELVDPLVAAGRLTIDLIKEARAKAIPPEDPDLSGETVAGNYFEVWNIAMKNAGPEARPKFRSVLEDIEREANPGKTEMMSYILRTTHQELEELGPVAQ
jgi:hypothetical protein